MLLCIAPQVSLKFNDNDLLLMAVTHPSSSSVNNSRLVALGTNVIKSALTEYIFVRYPHLPGDCILYVKHDVCQLQIAAAVLNLSIQNPKIIQDVLPLMKCGHFESIKIVIHGIAANRCVY